MNMKNDPIDYFLKYFEKQKVSTYHQGHYTTEQIALDCFLEGIDFGLARNNPDEETIEIPEGLS